MNEETQNVKKEIIKNYSITLYSSNGKIIKNWVVDSKTIRFDINGRLDFIYNNKNVILRNGVILMEQQ